MTKNFREYHNERYRTISGIVPFLQERNISACTPLTFPSCSARKWLLPTCSFVPVLPFYFLWKRETRQTSPTSDFVVCVEMPSWVPAVSEVGDTFWGRKHGHRRSTALWSLCVCVEGCILVEFLEIGETINAARYVQTLNKFRRALRENVQRKKNTVILQHYNARPHTARLTLQTIQKNGWELLFHPPPRTTIYSGPWKNTWEVTTKRLTKQSKKRCEGRCEELERTSTAEACLRFCNADRNT
jgi:hypothetical protein